MKNPKEQLHSLGFFLIFIGIILLLFLHPCTKECNLLYKTINSSVQKKDLFCTRIQKDYSYKISNYPREKIDFPATLIKTGVTNLKVLDC